MKFSEAVKGKIIDAKPLKPNNKSPIKVKFDSGITAVARVKTRKKQGKVFKRGLPVSSLIYREMAYYNLDRLLGFDLCPDSTFGSYEGHEAVFCAWIEAQPVAKLAGKMLTPTSKRGKLKVKRGLHQVDTLQIVQSVIESVIACSRDAHSGNLLVQDMRDGKRLWSFDNEASFGYRFDRFYDYLHLVYFFNRFSVPLYIKDLLAKIEHQDLSEALGGLINDLEVEHTYRRVQYLLQADDATLGYDYLSKTNVAWFFGDAPIEKKEPAKLVIEKPLVPEEDYANWMGFL